MVHTVEEIKLDLFSIEPDAFLQKYIINGGNWYFKEILKIDDIDMDSKIKEFKEVFSTNLKINSQQILVVGSSKIGFSLSPNKFFRPFIKDIEASNPSDIDIAIISDEIYHKFWKLFRSSYNPKYQALYGYISREIYRGYINERNINEIQKCRIEWNQITKSTNRKLKSNFYIKHDITYRIYRNWDDFNEYNIESIKSLKRRGGSLIGI